MLSKLKREFGRGEEGSIDPSALPDRCGTDRGFRERERGGGGRLRSSVM